MDQLLKITYHLGDRKINTYIKMRPPTIFLLNTTIVQSLRYQYNQYCCDIRTYWLDEDKDEIEIATQADYEIFLSQHFRRHHLHVAALTGTAVAQKPSAKSNSEPVKNTSDAQKTEVPPAAGSYDNAVHNGVECDNCLMAPVVGFRYKCIDCPDYDLCQNCEAKRVHSAHMMVRMPTNDCPTVIDAYITGRSTGRSTDRPTTSRGLNRRRITHGRNGLSVVVDDNNENVINVQPKTAVNGKEPRLCGRKQHRRQTYNNFFGHLFDMMHDLADGGGADAAAYAIGGQTPSATKPTTTSTCPQTKSSTTASTSMNKEYPSTIARFNATGAKQNKFKDIAADSIVESLTKIRNAIRNTETSSATANNGSSTETGADDNLGSLFVTLNDFLIESAKKAMIEPWSTSQNTANFEPSATASNGSSTETADKKPSKQQIDGNSSAQYYIKNGIEILNGIFSKIIDPISSEDEEENLPKKSAVSTVGLSSDTTSDKEKSLEQEQTPKTECSVNDLEEGKENQHNTDSTEFSVIPTLPSDTASDIEKSVEQEQTPKTECSVNDLEEGKENQHNTDSTEFSVIPSLSSDTTSDIEKSVEQEQNLNPTTSVPSTLISINLGSDTTSIHEMSLDMQQEQKPCDTTSDKEINLEQDKDSESGFFIPYIEDLSDNDSNSDCSDGYVKVDSFDIVGLPTQPKPLYESATTNFNQLSSDLLAHIAQEDAAKVTEITKETIKTTTTSTASTNTIEPVVATTSSQVTSAPQDNRAVLVLHPNQRINESILAMMGMGFSNENDNLTQLLESVDGNIAEALDLMTLVQGGDTH